jgi:hypothetical protein
VLQPAASRSGYIGFATARKDHGSSFSALEGTAAGRQLQLWLRPRHASIRRITSSALDTSA